MAGEQKKQGNPPEKKGGGLFGSKAPKQPEGPSMSYLAGELSSANRRTRMLEERFRNMNRKVELIEKNMISNHQKLTEDLHSFRSDIDDISHTLKEIENKIILIIKELRMTAKKDEVTVLKRYLELWEPVNFITYEKVEQLIDEKLAESKQEESGESGETEEQKPKK